MNTAKVDLDYEKEDGRYRMVKLNDGRTYLVSPDNTVTRTPFSRQVSPNYSKQCSRLCTSARLKALVLAAGK